MLRAANTSPNTTNSKPIPLCGLPESRSLYVIWMFEPDKVTMKGDPDGFKELKKNI